MQATEWARLKNPLEQGKGTAVVVGQEKPAGQVVHEPLLASAYVPDGQVRYSAEVVDRHIRPARHAVQDITEPVLYEPVAHWVMAPGSDVLGQANPGGQAVQLDAPATL